MVYTSLSLPALFMAPDQVVEGTVVVTGMTDCGGDIISKDCVMLEKAENSGL